jgi:GxxExxY protein
LGHGAQRPRAEVGVNSYFIHESDEICHLAWAVWHKLGNGFTREVYADALELEFTDAGIPYQREQSVPIFYKNIVLPHTYTADFIVHDKIVLRVASQCDITETEKREILSILNASKRNLGIYINYADKAPQFNRVIVKTKFHNSNSLRKSDNKDESENNNYQTNIKEQIVNSDFSALCSLHSERDYTRSLRFENREVM